MKMLRTTLAVVILTSSFHGAAAQTEKPAMPPEQEAKVLIKAYTTRYQPVLIEANRAWWEASTTGSNEAFDRKKKADKALVALHSDTYLADRVNAILKSGAVTDPVERRQLEVMRLHLLAAHADPDLQNRIVDLQSDIEQTFNTHRSDVGGKLLTENEVRAILAETTDSKQAEAAWKGYMQVGRKADGKLRELVALRNELARQLGYPDFHAYKLASQEIEPEPFFALFDELDRLTAAPFAEIKARIDAARAKKFGVAESDLRPWHFGDLFFQEAPEVEGVDLDAVYRDVDLVALTKHYYQSLGFECEDIFARSDLLEKEGKSPHAFATDIDREGDIRVLCNIKPNLYWADTTMHEIGHAVYDKYIDRALPFTLREASHSITTEGVAMMFGAIVKNADFLARVRKLKADEAAAAGRAAADALRMEKLMFARWTQVMVRFEHGLYTQPDQDLGKLWWGLKKRYQLLNPPESTDRPDYAAKVHILTEPVYYHSYLMGDLFAAQVRNTIARRVLGQASPGETSFFGETKAGDYLRREVFGPGNLYSWNELTKRATGEPLTAKYFAEQFVR
ncbi:MAG: M2 family metallopeptidase [Phycisphaerae bacterium]|nr:MAG: peptidase M3 [Planctomycetota bacterium]KAB2945306.1 MAG: M2 family metallopeptidase [Phycisphaerae bacterium]MBE7458881.1 M2 family metallopeptidase [Planctomycetia bacterium]MCL4720080.1 M2 family metallopeptidase [Phycisphaerae bacterium]MCQ3922356.1 peptidase M3 [Planctomycetota bacterium]